MPAGVANGGYANAVCRPGFDRERGHTVFLCVTSKPLASQWQLEARGGGGEQLLCQPQAPGGCSGSPDPAKHYQSRTLSPDTAVEATCADGYRAENVYIKSIYNCEGDKRGNYKWVHVDDPAGQPVVCTAEPGGGYCTGPPREHFRSVTVKDGGYVVAACEDGYVGTGSSVFVCRANNEDVWDPSGLDGDTKNLVCTPPTCSASPANHTQGKCAGTQVGQPCTAECANGYTPQGNPTYTCGEDGAWTGGSLRCLKSCTLPQSLPRNWHAVPLEGKYAACVAGQALAAGEKCTIDCQAGYSQEADGTYAYECGLDSQLVPPSPDCQLCSPNTFNPTPGASACEACGAHCTSKRGSVQCNCTTPTPCNGVDCGHGSCQALGNTSHTCQCEDGWTQSAFGEGPCDHPTGCDDGPCQNEGTCKPDDTGGFACDCVGQGWKWGGKTCTEPMGCQSHSEPCKGHGQCIADRVTGDGFSCNCTQGWSGKNCEIEPPPAPAPDGPARSNKDDIDWKMWGPIIGGGVAALLGLACCCRVRRVQQSAEVLRESLLGSLSLMPEVVLTKADARARWNRSSDRMS
eukprot:COSAG01_NODE_10199_length_2222_cov_1.994821_1_plen_572_part_01